MLEQSRLTEYQVLYTRKHRLQGVRNTLHIFPRKAASSFSLCRSGSNPEGVRLAEMHEHESAYEVTTLLVIKIAQETTD